MILTFSPLLFVPSIANSGVPVWLTPWTSIDVLSSLSSSFGVTVGIYRPSMLSQTSFIEGSTSLSLETQSVV